MAARTKRQSGRAKEKPSAGPVWRFILWFVLILVGGGGAYAYLSSKYHESMLWIMRGTATVTGWVVSIFSDAVTYHGQMCSFQGFNVKIIDECTGLFEMVIYSAAVLAFPTTWKNKGIGLLMGIPGIYLFNLIRIIVLLVVGAYSYRTFEFMHLYFWQVTLIIIIASIWIGWLLLVVNRGKNQTAVSG